MWYDIIDFVKSIILIFIIYKAIAFGIFLQFTNYLIYQYRNLAPLHFRNAFRAIAPPKRKPP